MKQFTFRDKVPGLKSSILMLTISFGALAFLSQGAIAQKAAAEVSKKDTQAIVTPKTVAALEKRVKSLEAQIVDLRAMIGTFASMARGTSGSARQTQNGAQNSAQSSRVNVPSSNLPSSNLPWQGNQPKSQNIESPSERLASREGPVDPAETATDRANKPPVKAVTEPSNSEEAQTLYKDAYSHMLRRDYASAESAFGSLLKNHPQSRMAGNAQYWLGETYYVRGKYRPAADAFLKAYRNYSNGIKAPDSLMKLALSLTRLGQKTAACRTFEELDAKYPNAPNHVKQRAGMERRRAGCN